MAKAQTVFTGFALALTVFAHGLVGLLIFFSGLVTHPALWGAGLLAWAFGIYAIVRWRRGPGRLPFIPVVLAGTYFLALVIGERVGLVGA